MAFFELTSPERFARTPPPEPTPGWIGPPDDVMPAVVPLELFVYHDDSVAVVVNRAEVYPVGCSLWLTILARLREADDEERGTRIDEAIFADTEGLRRLGSLSDALMRFGVVYPDGTKATTLEHPPIKPEGDEEEAQPRSPVLLQHEHDASGGYLRWETHQELWLWPLPPAEPFDLVIEWPALGIPLTRASLDGAALNRAAARSRKIWS